MNSINWTYIGLGILFTILSQLGAWFQHNLQFKYENLGPTWWGWYLVSIPLTYVFILATKYNVEGYGGSLWASRFVGFAIGMAVYAIMLQIYFKEPFTWKVALQLILCLIVILVQTFLKD